MGWSRLTADMLLGEHILMITTPSPSQTHQNVKLITAHSVVVVVAYVGVCFGVPGYGIMGDSLEDLLLVCVVVVVAVIVV